jgi:hypothetical protein
VNDPRNFDIMGEVQMMKNDYLDSLLSNDAKFQLYNLESFRHKLLKARMNDPYKANVSIP